MNGAFDITSTQYQYMSIDSNHMEDLLSRIIFQSHEWGLSLKAFQMVGFPTIRYVCSKRESEM